MWYLFKRHMYSVQSNMGMERYLDLFIDLVNECLEEVQSVLLLSYVHRSVAPQTEHLPKPLGDIVL